MPPNPVVETVQTAVQAFEKLYKDLQAYNQWDPKKDPQAFSELTVPKLVDLAIQSAEHHIKEHYSDEAVAKRKAEEDRQKAEQKRREAAEELAKRQSLQNEQNRQRFVHGGDERIVGPKRSLETIMQSRTQQDYLQASDARPGPQRVDTGSSVLAAMDLKNQPGAVNFMSRSEKIDGKMQVLNPDLHAALDRAFANNTAQPRQENPYQQTSEEQKRQLKKVKSYIS